MGRPKLLLPWGETSVLGHLIRQWRALGAKQIAVVCAPGDRPIQAELDRLVFHELPLSRPTASLSTHRGKRSGRGARPGRFMVGEHGVITKGTTQDRIINPAPERGMFSSIQCAAEWPGWQAALTHWAFVLGDQPHLRPQTLRQVLDFSAAHPTKVCQPARCGHGRHPVLLPQTVFRQLAGSTAATLKEFLLGRSREVALCEVDDPGMEVDIDRPEDYDQAVELAAKHRAKR